MVLFFGGCFAPEGKREKLRLQAGREKEGRQREDSLFIRSLSSAGSYLREAPARDGSAILLATTASRPMCHERDWVAVDVRRVHIRPSLRYQPSAKAEF